VELLNLVETLPPQGSEQQLARCPHLGVPRDPHTWASYVSGDNVCHKTQAEVFLTFEHQAGYCLSAGHGRCPIFQAQGNWNQPLPPGVQASSNRPVSRVNLIIGGVIALMMLLGAALIVLAFVLL
jgi:hypothetical protein